MRVFTIFFVLFFGLSSYSQTNYDPNRYQEPIFNNSLTTNDIQYGSAPQWVWPYWDEDLYLNVSVPNGDNNQKRPLIIFAHAGGFINGSKDVDNMVAICDSFAKKGFVTATIDYRKGFNPLDEESAERAVYRGIQDGKTAVRYFKTNASLYDIDTNYIFFGGMSAGGFITLHVAYMDLESERPSSTYGGGTVNDLGCLDCGDHSGVTSTILAGLDYWGAVQDTNIIENGNQPLLIMHGENDGTVPYETGYPFGLSTLPATHGGKLVHERCDHLGIENTFIHSSSSLHMLEGSDNGTWDPAPNAFWGDTLLPVTTDFIYELIKPNTQRISDETTTICAGDELTFEVTENSTSHFIWDYNLTQTSVIADNNSHQLTLEFTQAGTYNIQVVEFNSILCAGDTIPFTVIVDEYPSPDFIANTIDYQVDFTNNTTNGFTYEWDFGDGQTSTDNQPTHTYLENGDYEVTLTAYSENGCESTYTETVSISVSLADINNNEFNFQLINPIENQLQITSNQDFSVLAVYDINGKMMITPTQAQQQSFIYDTGEWENGVYLIQIKDIDGKTHQLKVVKM